MAALDADDDDLNLHYIICARPDLITVEHKDLTTKQATERLHRLCLPGTSRPVWVASKTNSHCCNHTLTKSWTSTATTSSFV